MLTPVWSQSGEAKSKFDITVEGAAILATQKLHRDIKDRTARDLVEFVLVLDPKNEEATALKEAIKTGRQIGEPDTVISDDGAMFSGFLAGLAAQFSKSRNSILKAHSLPFYALALRINAENEASAAALAKAKQAGQKTDFPELLDALKAARRKAHTATIVKKAREAGGGELARADYTLTARRLFDAFQQNMIDATNKYRGKIVRVSGELTDIGKSSGRRVLEVDDGKVTASLSARATRSSPMLEAEAQHAKLLEYIQRTRRRRDTAYYYIEVSVAGQCTGYGGGKVLLQEAGGLRVEKRDR